MAGLAPKLSIPDLKDYYVEEDTDTDDDKDYYVEGEADDEYFDSQDNLSPQITSTFTPKIIDVTDDVTAAESSGQITGEAYAAEVTATQQTTDNTGNPTSQVTGEAYASEVTATKQTRDNEGNLTSQKVKISQTTGTITGQVPTPAGAKQVKVSGQVTEVSAAEGPADTSGDQTPRPGIGSSTPRSSRSIRKAISAMLDGSPFKSSSSNNVSRPQSKYYEELDSSPTPTPQPKPRSQTAADPPRAPMPGYEFVWYPAGYWAEREIVERPKKSIRPPRWVRRSMQDSAQVSPIASAPRSLNPSEVWAKNPEDIKADEEEEEEEREADGPQRRRASTPPGTNRPNNREASTPRTFLKKLHQISHSRKASASGESKGKGPEARPESSPIDLERQTAHTLQGTSNFFSKFLAGKRQNERAMHPLVQDERATSFPRKRFGFAPWHQNDSDITVRSATSSLRQLLLGKTPASTPDRDECR